MNQRMQMPVTVIAGIGDETAEQLRALKIQSIYDLLHYFPFRYDHFIEKTLYEAEHEERITVVGIVQTEPSVRYMGRNKNRLSFRMLVDQVLITVTFFNRAFLKNNIVPGKQLTITGKWDKHRLAITGNELKVGKIDANEAIMPVYSVTGKITVKRLQRFVKQACEEYAKDVPELLPQPLIERYKLPNKVDALTSLHFPANDQALKQARRRFVYEEFFLFQLKMQLFRKLERERTKGKKVVINEQKLNEFIESLPFPLTNAQSRVVSEIIQDMSSPLQMSRLLQGDVGSGKTIVAAIAMYAVVQAGEQAALMVPTEILAEQHVHSLKEVLEPFGLRVELLSSSIKGKRRRELLAEIEAGTVPIVVGTHALIQDDVLFRRLGLVITDEQHRFGVGQRRLLKEKGEHVDVLFMTATPIPRTLAISAFGDMDVSIIDELPAGRKVIETYWARHEMFARVLDFIEKELTQGRQAYVICPLIEESEKVDVQNAIDVHAQLQQHYSERWNVGLMHGRLHSDEKDEIMQAFDQHKIDILVSTTVVEVGVNVPNATVMVVYDAERFGLAQLHQLRGRVGRGQHQSYCILLADPKTDIGKERMQIMTETNDGFALAERDLQLRGPGEFFGAKQSGLPSFKVADIVHDYRALEVARNDAALLVNHESFWTDEQYAQLREYLEFAGAFDRQKLD